MMSRITYRNGNVCAVFNCDNRSSDKDGKSFYRFPKEKKICKQWILACRRSDLDATFLKKGLEYINRMYLICSDHFSPETFMNPDHKRSGLIKGSVPSVNLPFSNHQDSKRHGNSKKRSNLLEQATIPPALLKLFPVLEPSQRFVEPSGKHPDGHETKQGPCCDYIKQLLHLSKEKIKNQEINNLKLQKMVKTLKMSKKKGRLSSCDHYIELIEEKATCHKLSRTNEELMERVQLLETVICQNGFSDDVIVKVEIEDELMS